ncbi:L-serine ammonia-lyase, iron-sulfur-dependent, subunit alpha [uncultured Alistipes sp.]|uniref:L-cysteine desulfidase family protein n=1 Tax=uncultured Alistipes sp. TaxID=538949 RepID=UPI002606742C|nr:L-serine ammonia-lyase, iron-sulfur-dependent, subunit alpha [uncultured Alistipes sp.]
MIPAVERKAISDLLQREVVPAIGCTEPMAVALCTARARELLETVPERIDVMLSANILKNAMGVGIPGTGMIGLPVAVALGAHVGRSEYGLEVLRDVTPEAVAEARRYLAEERIAIALKEGAVPTLYVEVECRSGNRRAAAIIADTHTRFVYLSLDDKVLLDLRDGAAAESEEREVPLTLRRVYDYAVTSPIEELAFIDEAQRLNISAAELAFKGEYGHSLGRTLCGEKELHVMGNTLFSRILAYTSAACDARMAGAMVPVMSNSGSGNQGIAATVPVAVYAEQTGATKEQTRRALVLSHLTAVYIKQSLGRLSALCGCVVAATGSSCGITYLMGGGYREITYAVQNMIANLTGMICDGAKPSCALKVSSGVSTAVMSALLAIEGKCVTSVEGIIDEDVDRSIRNLTAIGRDGMAATDRLVLDIMTHKGTGGC